MQPILMPSKAFLQASKLAASKLAASKLAACLLAACLLAACTVISPSHQPDESATRRTLPQEHPITILPLAGPAAQPEAEISGLAWYSDTLVLLPQYPSRMASPPGSALLGLPKGSVLDFLDGKSSAPLQPFEIPLDTGRLEKKIPGFEGYEAVAFLGEHIYLTIEARQGLKMRGYLVSGVAAPDLSTIRLDPGKVVEIPLPANLLNQSDEAIVVAGDQILTFYEVNDPVHNPHPAAQRFDDALQPLDPVPFPNLPYRLTDACPADEQGRFWVIDYFFPGDFDLRVDRDPLAEEFGKGPTHARSQTVERLVEMQYASGAITLAGKPPVQLELEEGESRNWEGLACLKGRGFLLATDKFPGTLLGFIAYKQDSDRYRTKTKQDGQDK